MAAAQVDVVRGIAAAAVERSGLVLENVVITPAGRRRVVRVVVDLPADRTGGVPMDDVARASQAISSALDDSDALGSAPYTLEVTSPGAERPLTERRHYARARGRLVILTLADGSAVEGRLTAVDDDGLTLAGGSTLPWDDVVRGRIRLEFGMESGGDA